MPPEVFLRFIAEIQERASKKAADTSAERRKASGITDSVYLSMLAGVFGLARAHLFRQCPCNMLAPTVLLAAILQPKIIIEPETAEVKAVSSEISDNRAVLFDTGPGTGVTWLDAGRRKTSPGSVLSV
jgi:hypothetical protein